jgi:hypothetical protein
VLCIKGYEAHCPSPFCTGGHKNKLRRIRGSANWLPPKIWAKKNEQKPLYRCTSCGLVWFQKRSKRPGFDARPIGYYDNFDHPWEFVSFKGRLTIREQNTSRYWSKVGSKRKTIHPPRRGGVDYGVTLVIDSDGNVIRSAPSEGLLKSSN